MLYKSVFIKSLCAFSVNVLVFIFLFLAQFLFHVVFGVSFNLSLTQWMKHCYSFGFVMFWSINTCLLSVVLLCRKGLK